MSVRPAHITAGQLALELPAELPALALAPEWKDQQRLWGHTFHPMCSYLASFPAALTHAFIARYSRPGDVVLDPFSGRGTTPLQACAEGRIGVGNDLNPFAHLLTGAKVEPASPPEARTRLAALRLAWASAAPGWIELAGEVVASSEGSTARVPRAGSG
ncbi:MAG: DNA methyltransferase, partial [Chloroflexota bacterium]